VSTNIDIIRDALGLIAVISEVETPSAEQGSHALRVLNQMMEQWEEEGVNLQYHAQTLTSDTFPCPPYTEPGVTGHLAMRLAPSYGASITVELIAQADAGYQTILRKSVSRALEPADMTHLPQGEGRYGTDTSILTDS
jgi:hypothetical protein